MQLGLKCPTCARIEVRSFSRRNRPSLRAQEDRTEPARLVAIVTGEECPVCGHEMERYDVALAKFIVGYSVAALASFTQTVSQVTESGAPSPRSFSPEAWRRIEADCSDFFHGHRRDLEAFESSAGGDFWDERNGRASWASSGDCPYGFVFPGPSDRFEPLRIRVSQDGQWLEFFVDPADAEALRRCSEEARIRHEEERRRQREQVLLPWQESEQQEIMAFGCEGFWASTYRTPDGSGGWLYRVSGCDPSPSLQDALRSFETPGFWVRFHPYSVRADYKTVVWELALAEAASLEPGWRRCLDDWRRVCAVKYRIEAAVPEPMGGACVDCGLPVSAAFDVDDTKPENERRTVVRGPGWCHLGPICVQCVATGSHQVKRFGAQVACADCDTTRSLYSLLRHTTRRRAPPPSA